MILGKEVSVKEKFIVTSYHNFTKKGVEEDANTYCYRRSQ
mgnify:CR=1 FL=1